MSPKSPNPQSEEPPPNFLILRARINFKLIIQGLSLSTASQVQFTYIHILEMVLLESFIALSCYENFFLPTKSCI